MLRSTCILAAFCLLQAVCFAQDFEDHESHAKPDPHEHHGHHGEHGWMNPEHSDDWSDHLMRMDWGHFFEKINLHELLQDVEIQKMWENKDWERLVKRVMVYMHSKDGWREMNHEMERHRESRRRCKLAALIAAPIGGILLLALFAFIIVKCVKKNNRKGQKGRIVYPSAAAAPMPYYVGTEEKKLKPEEAFGPAFGPGLDTPPPAYPAETEKPTAPEV